MAETKRRIPYCPLLSASTDDCKVCLQENCAWYMANTKTCAIYVMGHNNVLEIKAKQGK